MSTEDSRHFSPIHKFQPNPNPITFIHDVLGIFIIGVIFAHQLSISKSIFLRVWRAERKALWIIMAMVSTCVTVLLVLHVIRATRVLGAMAFQLEHERTWITDLLPGLLANTSLTTLMLLRGWQLREVVSRKTRTFLIFAVFVLVPLTITLVVSLSLASLTTAGKVQTIPIWMQPKVWHLGLICCSLISELTFVILIAKVMRRSTSVFEAAIELATGGLFPLLGLLLIASFLSQLIFPLGPSLGNVLNYLSLAVFTVDHAVFLDINDKIGLWINDEKRTNESVQPVTRKSSLFKSRFFAGQSSSETISEVSGSLRKSSVFLDLQDPTPVLIKALSAGSKGWQMKGNTSTFTTNEI